MSHLFPFFLNFMFHFIFRIVRCACTQQQFIVHLSNEHIIATIQPTTNATPFLFIFLIWSLQLTVSQLLSVNSEPVWCVHCAYNNKQRIAFISHSTHEKKNDMMKNKNKVVRYPFSSKIYMIKRALTLFHISFSYYEPSRTTGLINELFFVSRLYWPTGSPLNPQPNPYACLIHITYICFPLSSYHILSCADKKVT